MWIPVHAERVENQEKAQNRIGKLNLTPILFSIFHFLAKKQ